MVGTYPIALWASPPPKEGRGNSSSLFLYNRRWTTMVRLLVLSLTVAAIYITITPFWTTPYLSRLQSEDRFNIHKPLREKASARDSNPLIDIQDPGRVQLGGRSSGNELHLKKESASNLEMGIQTAAQQVLGDSLSTKTGEKSNPKFEPARDPQLEAALATVISLLPNELATRELLRPVEGTGEEKLREMGLRARAFKTLFEAWEAVHLVSSGDDVHIRDDIIPYLRSRQHSSSSLASNFAQTVHSYEAYRSFLQRLSTLLFPWTAPFFADHMSLHVHIKNGGRGIVLTCGDGQAPYLLTTIALFRRLGCTLPIEVMYLGDSDLSEDYQADLEALPGVITRDISQMVNDEGWKLKGWAAKPFAILLSSFREVIFIDADALFFKNPEVLFSDPLYAETGTLFFHDRIIMPESKKRWLKAILPNPISSRVRKSRFWTGESGHMQESGVVVVDKWRHIVALLMVTRMNGPDRDGNKDKGLIGVYDMVYGDKETFWLGWELVGDLEYSFHTGDAGILGVLETPTPMEERKERQRKKDQKKGDDTNERTKEQESVATQPQNYTICAPQLLHLDTDNRPLWFNGWIVSNKFAEENQKVGGRFELFLKEPTDGRKPDPWQLREHNEACLTTDETSKFTADEINTLNMIVALAKEVGAYGKD